jgi:CMP-N,N'-diacetyllegionaminic acid synthase
MMKNFKVLCVIPAREGSKGIPLKNITPLNGKPLLHYSLTAALKAKLIDHVVVSSDSNKILNIAKSYGDNIPLKRPVEISGDLSPSYEAVLHALQVCESKYNIKYNYVILVQATNPLVIPDDIDNVINMLHNQKSDSCVTVTSLGYLHPNKFKILNGNKLLPFVKEEKEILPRQKLMETFIRNGSCYATKRNVLEHGDLVGKKVTAVVTPKERYVDINDMIDLKIAECLMANFC